MPKKKFLESASSSVGATGMLEEPIAAPKPAPAAFIPKDTVKERPAAPIARDSMSSLTARLGANFWETNARFEWAKAPNNHHYEFTRFYFDQNVLVDVWPNQQPSSKKVAEHKRELVDAENVRRIAAGEKPLGLLAVVRGAIIPDEYFDRALAGETFPLIERATEGVLV